MDIYFLEIAEVFQELPFKYFEIFEIIIANILITTFLFELQLFASEDRNGQRLDDKIVS